MLVFKKPTPKKNRDELSHLIPSRGRGLYPLSQLYLSLSLAHLSLSPPRLSLPLTPSPPSLLLALFSLAGSGSGRVSAAWLWRLLCQIRGEGGWPGYRTKVVAARVAPPRRLREAGTWRGGGGGRREVVVARSGAPPSDWRGWWRHDAGGVVARQDESCGGQGASSIKSGGSTGGGRGDGGLAAGGEAVAAPSL